MGDRTPCTRVAHAGLANRVDGGELGIGQPGGAERARRSLRILQPVLEQCGAAFDRGRGVVQLVRESRGQFAERDHLLVVQIARGESAGAIDHAVDEDRRDLITLAGHLAQMIPMNRQDLDRLLRDRITRWADQAGVRKHARNVALSPFHDLVKPGAAVDGHGDAPRQYDEQAFYPCALRGQHVARLQLSKRSVRGQPRQFLARRRAQSLVLRQPIDEIHCCHLAGVASWTAEIASSKKPVMAGSETNIMGQTLCVSALPTFRTYRLSIGGPE